MVCNQWIFKVATNYNAALVASSNTNVPINHATSRKSTVLLARSGKVMYAPMVLDTAGLKT